MSIQQDSNSDIDFDAQAFEYSAGTLRGEEKRAFELKLKETPELEKAVEFWQEQLMVHHHSTKERQPDSNSWDTIVRRINEAERPITKPSWLSLFRVRQFALPLSVAWALLISVWAIWEVNQGFSPNSDYVAVLTDEGNQPVLTALTSAKGDILWLQWESALVKEGESVQLWAQSRRDGQIRPLYVFSENNRVQIPLDEAAYRLVRDSEYLILTVEEEGGSALDEPSELVLAKGVCVRLTAKTI